MKNRFQFACLLFVCFCFQFRLSVAQVPVQYTKEVEEKIKQVENNLVGKIKIVGEPNGTLKERMAFYNINGLSIAVIHNYKIEWAKGYGWADVGEKRPVTTATFFQPGSIGKSLNSMGVLKLAQDKKLDIYADINKYLTSWKFPYDTVSHNKKITTANLLSHSAGLNGRSGSNYTNADSIPTITQTLDGLKPATSLPVRSIFEPGLKFSYSNGGVAITQCIVSDISKKSYEQYMEETVLKPLGMVNSFYTQPPPVDKRKNLATGYQPSGEEVIGKYNFIAELAAGSLWTTPTDFCKFIIETQLSYQGKSNKVLSQQMTRNMLTPCIVSSGFGDSAGLGVFINKIGSEKYFTHNGGRVGFSSIYYGSVESGDGVVVFINSNNDGILQEVVNSVATVYNWKDFCNPILKKVIPVSDNLMNKYVGIYQADNGVMSIYKKDDKYMFYNYGKSVKMYFTTEKDFFNLEFTADKQFYTDEKGKVLGFTRKAGNIVYSNAIRIENIDSLTAPPEIFTDIAWAELESKNYERSIQLYKRALVLYPNDLAFLESLGHAYLWSNNYEKAIEFYKKYMDKNIPAWYSKEKVLDDDFVSFRTKGLSAEIMNKVFKELNITPSKEYLNVK